MIFRKATRHDIPAIVELLKLSVGESLMPKTEAFWKWKHIDNPFGESEVQVSVEGERIVGVRAFMKWDWRHGNTNIRSVRAVDTGTHPEYQGQGIFKGLNARLISENQSNVDFIFNTPNKKTESGNLKLGWFRYKKMSIRIRLCPQNFLKKRMPVGDILREFSITKILDKIQSDHLEALKTKDNDYWTTNLTVEYLKWRYVDIPGVSYFGILDNDQKSYLAFFRIKVSRKGISELRLCDILYSDTFNQESFNNQVKQIIRLIKPAYVSAAAHTSKALTKLLFFPALSIGPQVTIRGMKREVKSDMLDQYWRPSIGDLEIF